MLSACGVTVYLIKKRGIEGEYSRSTYKHILGLHIHKYTTYKIILYTKTFFHHTCKPRWLVLKRKILKLTTKWRKELTYYDFWYFAITHCLTSNRFYGMSNYFVWYFKCYGTICSCCRCINKQLKDNFTLFKHLSLVKRSFFAYSFYGTIWTYHMKSQSHIEQ